MTSPSITLEALTILDARGVAIVDQIDLCVPAGRPLAIIGETGSGKSLIAQAVLGLLPRGFRASGGITVGRNPPIDAADKSALQQLWARDVMLLPQEPRAALDPTMRIGSQLAEGGGPGAPSVSQALAAVSLSADLAANYPFALSGGMAQRVLVGMALMSAAPLIIADEPTKGLDSVRITQTIDLLRSLVSVGRSLIVITHDLSVVRGLDGDVAVLKDGRIVEHGPVATVFANPQHAYTRDWLAADPDNWETCERCLDMDALVLAAHGLRFRYGRSPLLFDDLDIHVPLGSVVGLTGPSGCGKSTLGNVLLGLAPPSAGEVSWAGADPYRDPKALRRLRRRYQKLHQDPVTAFLPHRTIGQHFEDLAELAGDLAAKSELPSLLDRLKLQPVLLQRYPSEISGGEAQRLALARLLMMEPSLIVVDEPTSRLDPLVQKQTMDLLRQIVAERSMSLILISHDKALVRSMADETIELGGSGDR
jgi:peptide/nickel transport system ATP-binding protein